VPSSRYSNKFVSFPGFRFTVI